MNGIYYASFDVVNCSACGENHEQLRFQCADLTGTRSKWSAQCPTNNKRLLITPRDEKVDAQEYEPIEGGEGAGSS